MLFFVACLGAVAGFLGVCIVTIHSYKIFYSMNTLIALVTAAKMAAVCFTLIYRVKTLKAMTTELEYRVGNYSTKSTLALDMLHTQDKCCGVTSPLDWANSTLAVNWTKTDVPNTCCLVVSAECGKDKANEDSLANLTLAIHQTGCYFKLEEWFDKRVIVVGVVAGVSTLCEVVMITISQKWVQFIELR